MKFGFDLDGDWFEPNEDVLSAIVAEKLGYESVWIGDHFMPWFDKGARAPAVWPWLGVALAKTSTIKVGPAVTVPIGGRYHPLLVGQAAATLDRMFPGRFLLGVGTGQAMSEQKFLGSWPKWEERGARLGEAVRLIRKLWAAEDYFDWHGTYFKSDNIFLYTKPAGIIEIYVSARGRRAARIAGEVGDHLMTTVSDPVKIREEIITEFEQGMRSTGRDPARSYKVGYLEFGIGEVDSMVRLLKESSAASGMVEEARGEIDPRKIQEMGSKAPTDLIIKHHHLVRKAGELIPAIQEMIEAGCNYLVFSDKSRHPRDNMKRISEEVIPQITG